MTMNEKCVSHIRALQWPKKMKARKFKPGDKVPSTGIYRVEHASHRLMHETTLLEKGLFPRCRECHSQVRFQLIRPVNNRRVLPFRSSAILVDFREPEPRIAVAS